ncbi:hypothetical protein [Methanoculleus sp. 10]|uniref:hypothetical protein n=1 Tax=Methanoculleus sp. 10 TaxID=430615 RepID=UPI0025DBBA98|nr:hypothetical protein [Methanoculleus sp. 10]
MRIALACNEGNRMPFKATFAFYERCLETGPNGRILLQDVKYGTEELIADHIWIHDNPSIKKMADLDEGDIIRFTALVYKYSRDYRQNKEDEESSDYGLKDIQNLAILTKGQRTSSRILTEGQRTSSRIFTEGQRTSISGTYFAYEVNIDLGPSILLKDISDTQGNRITSYGSIPGTIKDVFPVKQGDQIRFTAVVRRRIDYPWLRNTSRENYDFEDVEDLENLTNKPGCLS